MNSPEIKQFIKKNANLFWYIKEEEKENISINFLVETILNYGDKEDVKKLFSLIGIKKIAQIFYKQTSFKRNNYHNRTINYFNLYFKRHA
jgi:hypothetical protein